MTERKLPERAAHDTLLYCEELWWLFHCADSLCGLRSSMGAQIDMGELGATLQTDPVEPSVSLTGARRLRRLYAMLKLLSEYQYGVLRAWYTGAGNRPAEPVVAGAHRAFYELRGRK